jgi:hypothetical protein
MTPWNARFVKCPFYRFDNENRIVCEGLAEKNTINLVYESQADKKDYMRRRCNSIEGCRFCLIYRMLDLMWEEKGE